MQKLSLHKNYMNGNAQFGQRSAEIAVEKTPVKQVCKLKKLEPILHQNYKALKNESEVF